MNQQDLIDALTEAQSALELIASPKRPDGTYNRDRRACELLARDALAKISAKLNPPAAEVPLETGAGPFVVYSDGGLQGQPGSRGLGCGATRGRRGEVRSWRLYRHANQPDCRAGSGHRRPVARPGRRSSRARVG